jgi:ABC-2 type transport system permease protein
MSGIVVAGLIAALVVAAVVGLIVSVFGAVGLFEARSLLRREFAAYFLSPIAYVVLVVFLVVMGFLFSLTLGQLTTTGPNGTEYPLQYILGNGCFWLVFLFIPPLLTMRLFAEEQSTGTLEVLMTSPLRDWQIVLCKYLACLGFYLLLWLPTLLYLPVLLALRAPQWHEVWSPWTITAIAGLIALVVGVAMLWPTVGPTLRLINLGLLLGGLILTGLGLWGHYRFDPEHVLTIEAGIDPWPVLTSGLAIALAGAMFLALGMFVSSLVRSQMVAGLISLVLGLVFIGAGLLIVTDFWRPDLDTASPQYRAIYYFSVPLHFTRYFSRGVIDTAPLVLYGSMALFCLFLTVRSVESRRWR